VARLWRKFGGEPYLVNPSLVVALPNRKKRNPIVRHRKSGRIERVRRSGLKKHRYSRPRYYEVNMARGRDSKGRFLKRRSGGASNPKRRHRRRRHAAAANPRRHYRRSYAANPRRHHRRRRNPPIGLLGVTFPSIQTMAWSAGGFLAPPFVEGFARRFLPPSLTSTTLGKYAVKIGSVVLLTLGVRKLVGQEEGRNVMLGGSVYLAASLAQDFLMPAIAGTSARYYPKQLGYYNTGANLSAQPFLGGNGSAMTNNSPERLRPENRY